MEKKQRDGSSSSPEQNMMMAQPVAQPASALFADVRPLRALFEELVLSIRLARAEAGAPAPVISAALTMRYAGHVQEVTVPLDLDAESGAVCLSDPLPLDRAALQDAIATFQAAAATPAGGAGADREIEVVMLHVYSRDLQCGSA